MCQYENMLSEVLAFFLSNLLTSLVYLSPPINSLIKIDYKVRT